MVTDTTSTPHRPLSERQLAQRREAGKRSYALYIARILAEHPDDDDAAARHISGWRRGVGMKGRRGVTLAYVRAWRERMPQCETTGIASATGAEGGAEW